MTIVEEIVTLSTPTGDMRTLISRPSAEGRYPGIVFFSEIFQITDPIRRTSAWLAGHGFTVATPEVYHELLPAGHAIAYDDAGSKQGNSLKNQKDISAYDADARAALDCLKARADFNGKLGAIGICLGGHLAFRAAMNPDVQASACFYGTNIQNGTLGRGEKDGTLGRVPEIQGELLMVWGRQDPHVPFEGRTVIRQRIEEAGVSYQWIEVNAPHAFIRDIGPRYDPELAEQTLGFALSVFNRTLR